MIQTSDITDAHAMRMLYSTGDLWPLHEAASMGGMDICNSLENKLPFDIYTDTGTLFATPGRNRESVVLKCMNKGGTAPIVVANSESRGLMETVRPYASPIYSVPNWSSQGILPHAISKALKVDRVEATICSESSLFHSRSSEGHDTLNNTNPCIWRWPNWPKGDCHTAHESCVETCVETGTSKDGSITGSINSVHAAGAHEIGVTPGISCDYLVGSSSKSAAHASLDNCQDPIEFNHLVQLFVKLIDYPSISIQMECNASVSDMVKKALHKSGVYLPDSYVKVDGHIIAPDTVIIVSFRNATFTVSPRTRGGALDIPRSLSYEFKCVPLHDYLLGLGDSLFDVVRLRDSPCAPFVGDYFVSLGKSGRLVYKWLFSLVETFHAREKCLKTFTVEDIVYVREMGLVFYEPKEESFSQPGYRRNILNVGTILETYFRYSPSRLAAKGTEIHEMNKRQSQLPNHLHVLVQFIKDMPRCNAYEDGLTVVWRSIFLLDPTGMSAAAKIALMLSLDLKVKYLSNKQREDFDDALGKTENWKPLADAVPALKDVLNFRFFDRATRQYRTGYYDGTSLSSLWLLGRNYLSHSEKLQMDVKMAEAIFSFIFTYLLPLVIRALIRKYQNAAHPGAVQNSLTFRDILDME